MNIRRIIREEIDNVLNEFYNSSYALGDYKLTKFINDLDRFKNGDGKIKSIEELIYFHFPKLESNPKLYDSLYLVIQNYDEENISLREALKEIRQLGLLRGN